MAVSSIFSNPILSFSGTGRTRSRFFDDVDEDDDTAKNGNEADGNNEEEDDPIESLLRNPREIYQEEAI